MAKIFWVEDQSHWIERFLDVLRQADLEEKSLEEKNLDDATENSVEVFKFAEAAKQHISQTNDAPDIAILDANMNGNDRAGISVSRALKKKWPDLPIIYLSEHSGTGIEQQAFEETDPEDFIAKHQQNIEQVLCWRIKAALKKSQRSDKAHAESQLTSGNLAMDLDTWTFSWAGHKLMNPNNQQRPLPPTPRKILRYLVEASPRPLTTYQIVELLEADPERFSDANYRQHIRTLRQSIELAAQQAGQESFVEACKNGKGLVSFGEEGAYQWLIK